MLLGNPRFAAPVSARLTVVRPSCAGMASHATGTGGGEEVGPNESFAKERGQDGPHWLPVHTA